MNFTVIWQPTSEAMLATIWTSALDRNDVTQAANRIDRKLASDPSNEGESRADRFRILFESPLVADYEIDELKREVRVLRVRRMKA